MLNKTLQGKLISKVKNFSSDTKLHDFIDVLYAAVISDDTLTIEPQRLYDGAQYLYKLFQEKRKNGEYKINIYKPNKDDDDITVYIINDNVPFLVDSIINEMKKQDFDIQFVAHPIIACTRSTNGHLESFGKSSEKQYDSVMQIHISKRYEVDFYDKLHTTLSSVLECINYAVNDWQKMIAQMSMVIKEIDNYKHNDKSDQKKEAIEFLNWLIKDHFVFLGFFETKLQKNMLVPDIDSHQGLMKSQLYYADIVPVDDQYKFDINCNYLLIRKWDARSVVHRNSHMDCIIIKKFDNKGKCIGAYNFLGFFTSTVYYQSVLNIPLISKKVRDVVKKSGFNENGHNEKELVTALESLPRGELLQMSLKELLETSVAIVSLSLIPKVKIFIRKDITNKFVSSLIFIPRNRFSTDVRKKISTYLSEYFSGVISKLNVHWTEAQMVRLHIMVKTDPNKGILYNIYDIEDKIKEIVSVWQDNLYEALQQKINKKNAQTILNKYYNAFGVEYINAFEEQQAVQDILTIENIIDSKKPKFEVNHYQKDGEDIVGLKIFSPEKELYLSSIMPIVENMGFFAIDIVTYPLFFKNLGNEIKVFIHYCKLKIKNNKVSYDGIIASNIEEALSHIFTKDISDDAFNKLILYSGLNWREALLIRAYAKYLKQVKFPFEINYIIETLANNKEITAHIISLFHNRFNIELSDSKNNVDYLLNDIEKQLSNVSSISEDQVLRAYTHLILATKRTNFYQKDKFGNFKEYVSFKIASGELSYVPMPKPYFEIFVYSTQFEAVHLRGGAVARGGLRWSDRTEDFRTEVLGLMKAQMTKNSVIVPVGSKGGFVLKKVSIEDGRDKFLEEGISCYRKFLSGMLDITDNILDNKVVSPKDVIKHDQDDPYLVVAADKGTATFSDYANEVSENYGFWLGDAFASGGSAGYDHKKMGITAKGAWVSVHRHFREMGIDIDTTPFTVVGIGDMMGDVFGNGMLLSKCIKLVGAFNHIHIFVDPNPDHIASYKERERLFKLPRSQWTDYNNKLISKGGGIFNRSDKSIKISTEIAVRFNIQESELTPDELIVSMIKAEVDLLWNGGIGTYVKSINESHEEIGDKANDRLRVNGSELYCKVIGEGGNLGATQCGRMEYARKGGRVNTDFIDNSAGVDCSDHEVNIKIALVEALSQGSLNKKSRNKLLEKMTDDVGEMVLVDNYKQTQLITIEENNGQKAIESHAWLIKYLEDKGELNRSIEFLPNNEEIENMLSDGISLTRPSLSVLVAYAKNSMYKKVAVIKFDSSYFDSLLISYFPRDLQQKYKDIILNHKLRNEIIATILVNHFINIMGCTYFHQLYAEGSYTTEDIIKAFSIVICIFDIDHYWSEIEKLSGKIALTSQVALFVEIQLIMERNIEWTLRNHKVSTIDEITSIYKGGIKKLKAMYGSDFIHEELQEKFTPDVPSNILKNMTILSHLLPACDIIYIVNKTGVNIETVNKVFLDVAESISFKWLVNLVRQYMPSNYIDKQAIKIMLSEIENINMSLALQEVNYNKEGNNKCSIRLSKRFKRYKDFIFDIKNSTTAPVPSILMVVIRKVKEFLND